MPVAWPDNSKFAAMVTGNGFGFTTARAVTRLLAAPAGLVLSKGTMMRLALETAGAVAS
jgi:hypothetical protein